MKKFFVFFWLFVGGSLLATTRHYPSHSEAKRRFNWNFNGPVGMVSIVIDKSDYELSVYDEKGWYATYPVVFGNNSLEDKKMEGDKITPEGVFHINGKKVHDKWYRYLGYRLPHG